MNLEWIDGRWHLDKHGIHSGDQLWIKWPDGTWERVRVESQDNGRKLSAHFDYHGLELSIRCVTPETAIYELSWNKPT